MDAYIIIQVAAAVAIGNLATLAFLFAIKSAMDKQPKDTGFLEIAGGLLPMLFIAAALLSAQ